MIIMQNSKCKRITCHIHFNFFLQTITIKSKQCGASRGWARKSETQVVTTLLLQHELNIPKGVVLNFRDRKRVGWPGA